MPSSALRAESGGDEALDLVRKHTASLLHGIETQQGEGKPTGAGDELHDAESRSRALRIYTFLGFRASQLEVFSVVSDREYNSNCLTS